MNRAGKLGIVLLAAAVAVGMSGAVLAKKPERVVEWSNGFPSGEHYNLNIHGKKDNYQCDPSPGGKSIFTPEYGVSEIHYVMNKKKSLDTLVATDPCAGFDGDEAIVEIPSGEYQVYARILAKPAKSDEPREVVFYPKLVEACNDSGTENFSEAVNCDESFLLGTGVVTEDGAFDLNGSSLERVDTTGGKGKGKSTAQDITALFTWSGWACDQQYDTNGDGEMSVEDVTSDLNGDGIIDDADLQVYLETYCTYHESTWVFDIADLVVYGWDYHNNGAKLVQLRFYPVDTTTFE